MNKSTSTSNWKGNHKDILLFITSRAWTSTHAQRGILPPLKKSLTTCETLKPASFYNEFCGLGSRKSKWFAHLLFHTNIKYFNLIKSPRFVVKPWGVRGLLLNISTCISSLNWPLIVNLKFIYYLTIYSCFFVHHHVHFHLEGRKCCVAYTTVLGIVFIYI